MKLGAKGPCLDVSSACATGTHAIGEAMKIIQRGDAEVMVAGGTERLSRRVVFAGFCQAKALSRRNDAPEMASRPFDRDRDGFVLARGRRTGAGGIAQPSSGSQDMRNWRDTD